MWLRWKMNQILNVVACVTSYEEALQVIREKEVDVALVSTRLPDHGGLRLTSAISDIAPATKVLALGLTEEKKRVLRYVEAGAAGICVERRLTRRHDRNCACHAGGQGVRFTADCRGDDGETSDLAQMFAGVENNITDTTALPHERWKCWNLISKGFTNYQIAQHLVIEVGTVKNHVHNILEKLNVSSRGKQQPIWLLLANRNISPSVPTPYNSVYGPFPSQKSILPIEIPHFQSAHR